MSPKNLDSTYPWKFLVSNCLFDGDIFSPGTTATTTVPFVVPATKLWPCFFFDSLVILSVPFSINNLFNSSFCLMRLAITSLTLLRLSRHLSVLEPFTPLLLLIVLELLCLFTCFISISKSLSFCLVDLFFSFGCRLLSFTGHFYYRRSVCPKLVVLIWLFMICCFSECIGWWIYHRHHQSTRHALFLFCRTASLQYIFCGS